MKKRKAMLMIWFIMALIAITQLLTTPYLVNSPVM